MSSSLLKPTIAATVAILVGSWSSAGAQILYWTGSGTNPDTATSGNWDNFTTPSWTQTPSGPGTPEYWGNFNNAAVFKGPGGTVTVNDFIDVNSLTSAGGAYTFNTGAAPNTGNLNFHGTGVVNGSNLTFQGQGGILFDGSASAGTAHYNNAGAMSFLNSSTAGTAVINNLSTGSLTFENSSTGPAATLTNAGNLSFQDTSSAASTTISNSKSMDISSLTASGISATGLTQASGADTNLGYKTLNLTNFTLNADNNLDFSLNSHVDQGLITVGGTFLGNSSPNHTTINISDPGSLHGGDYTLIDFTQASVVTGVDLSDFVLGTLPMALNGSYLKFNASNNQLILAVVPEPSTYAMPVASLLALGWMRRRKPTATAAV